VCVNGSGEDASSWRTGPLGLEPGALYQLRFFGKRALGASGGTATSGVPGVNRDFPLTDTWQRCEYIFRTPDVMTSDELRLGQWHVRGGISFDEAGLWPVWAVHVRDASGLELGEGETTAGSQYRFQAHFGWAGANYHRTLYSNRAGFNSDRWVFDGGSEVIYRFQIAGCAQQSARFRAVINHYQSGALRIEAGDRVGHWVHVGTLDAKRLSDSFALPDSLFPVKDRFVRISQVEPTGSLQVNALEYQATLDRDVPTLRGETRFLEQHQGSSALRFGWRPWR
jgi:hypothetical protein